MNGWFAVGVLRDGQALPLHPCIKHPQDEVKDPIIAQFALRSALGHREVRQDKCGELWFITGCEFSAVQELLVTATEEGNSSTREWCGQKHAEDSGHSLAHNAGDRRVFWLRRSRCT